MSYTKDQAIEMARSNALTALDQSYDFDCVKDAIDSYRDNVRETLKEANSTEWEIDAFVAFDACIAKNQK